MSDKSLKDKAIDFKGKSYVLVADRILYFNETYPSGSIMTEVVSNHESDRVIVKATIKPVADENRAFTGYSQAVWGEGYINKTSALENAETSAVGRALAFMGIGVIESVASVDEIRKAESMPAPLTPKEAKDNAKKAIMESNNLDVLMEVEKKISKSKNLTDKDKEELGFLANERREDFDPTL